MSYELNSYFERGFTLSKIIDIAVGYGEEDFFDIIEDIECIIEGIERDLDDIDTILKQMRDES